MAPDDLQQILRGLFADSAGAVEAVTQTDRGAVWAFSLSGDYKNASGHWEPLREAMQEHELWPLLVGSEEELRQFANAHTENTDHANHDSLAVLAEGLSYDVGEWIRGHDDHEAPRRAQHEASQASPEYQAALQGTRDFEDDFDDFADEDPFADDPEQQDESPVLEAAKCQEEEWWFLLVPARHGWEVPATLCFGAWDVCPSPSEHVANIHYWHDRYGAQLIGLTHSKMWFQVACPPRSREESLPLARQMWHFCWKWIYEGFGDETPSPEQQADELTNRAQWSFAW